MLFHWKVHIWMDFFSNEFYFFYKSFWQAVSFCLLKISFILKCLRCIEFFLAFGLLFLVEFRFTRSLSATFSLSSLTSPSYRDGPSFGLQSENFRYFSLTIFCGGLFKLLTACKLLSSMFNKTFPIKCIRFRAKYFKNSLN